MRGWRAEKRKPMASASVAGYGGRLSARHTRSCSSDKRNMSTCDVFTVRRTALSPECPALGERVWCGPQVVSQLLAGHPSLRPGGDRRRPGVWLRTKPAGAAPRPASRRLMNAPLNGRGGRRIMEVCRAGISLRVSTSFQRKPESRFSAAPSAWRQQSPSSRR